MNVFNYMNQFNVIGHKIDWSLLDCTAIVSIAVKCIALFATIDRLHLFFRNQRREIIFQTINTVVRFNFNLSSFHLLDFVQF